MRKLRRLKILISVALIMATFMTSIVVIPAVAIVVPNAGMQMQGGYENVFGMTSELPALPSTYEATITPNSSYGDGYWGLVFGSRETKTGIDTNIQKAEFGIDLVKRSGDTDLGVRVYYGVSAKSVTGASSGDYYWTSATFDAALKDYKGKTVHIAVVFDGNATSNTGTLSLYIDGTKSTITPKITDSAKTVAEFVQNYYAKIKPANLENMCVGGDFRRALPASQWTVAHVDNYRYLRGKIHNAAMFSDIRSASEVASDVNARPTNDSNLISWYDFAKLNSDNTIPDDSGNGRTLKKGFEKGLEFTSGVENVFSATSKIPTLPRTFEMTYTPVLDSSGAYQVLMATTGDKEGGSDKNVPASYWMFDQIHAGTNSGYGPSLRIYALVVDDDAVTSKYGSVVFLGALGKGTKGNDGLLNGPVHIALTINPDTKELKLYINGVEWKGDKKYEYSGASNDAQFVELYNQIDISTTQSFSLGGDFRAGTPRYCRGIVYNAAMYSDVRIPETTYLLDSAGKVTSNIDKTGIIYHMEKGMPANDNDLMAWYNSSSLTSYGTLADASGNGYKLQRGFGVAAVSEHHVPADFDLDGVTDNYDWNGNGKIDPARALNETEKQTYEKVGSFVYKKSDLTKNDSGVITAKVNPIFDLDGDGTPECGDVALAISTLGELFAIERFVNKGTANHVGKGGKYYLVANIKIPTGTKVRESVLYDAAGSRFTESIYLDGCGYAIDYDSSNTSAETATALFGHGTYSDGDGSNKSADLWLWNLNVTGKVIVGSLSANVAPVMRTGTSGYTYFKNLVVSVDVSVAAATGVKMYDKNGAEITITGAQRSIAGIMAKNVEGDVLFEDVTFAGSVTSNDHMHDDGGAGDTSIYSSNDKKTIKSFYQTGLAAFMGTIDGANCTVTFKNCINMGVVKAMGQVGDDKGYSYAAVGAPVGGFLARAHASGNKVNFENCVNIGDIIAYNANNMGAHLGGFIASSNGSTINITDSKNLGVIRARVSTSGDGNAAGFIGRAIGSIVNLTNCTNEGAIKSTGKLQSAGIIGSAMWQNVTLDGCYNSGSVTVQSDVASGGSWEAFGIGGLVATLSFDNWEAWTFKLLNSGNSGDVTFKLKSGATNTKDAYLGGAVGIAIGVAHLLIQNCSNSGDITYNGNYSAWGSTAGILGVIQANRFSDKYKSGSTNYSSKKALNHEFKIESCVNTGKIRGGCHAGGILDGVKNFNTYDSAEYKPDSPGSATLTIQGCKNFGDVSQGNYGGQVMYGTGGIAGDLCEQKPGDPFEYNPYTLKYNILDCYNAGNITSGGEYVGGIVGTIRHYSGLIPATTVTHKIERCVNAGTVLATPYRGTVTKKSDGTYSVDNNTLNVPTRCGDAWAAFAGGIIAYFAVTVASDGTTLMAKLDIKNCINFGRVYMDKVYAPLNTSTGNFEPIDYTKEGYGTFPIINCCENRSNHGSEAKYTITATDKEGHTTTYCVIHINGGVESSTAKSGNVFLAASMTGRQAGEKYVTNNSLNPHWGNGTYAGDWSCTESDKSDEDHWHEFSDEASKDAIVTKLTTSTEYKDNQYYSQADKGLLRLMVDAMANPSNTGLKDRTTKFKELMDLLALCDTYKQENYSTETWAVFYRAKAEAEHPTRYTSTVNDLQKIINKLEAAKNNLMAPDYAGLINTINSTHIAEERLHNFKVDARMEYLAAVESAKQKLTSRSQVEIDAAIVSLENAYATLIRNYTDPAYTIVIPAEIPVGDIPTVAPGELVPGEVSVTTREFRDDCSLEVKVAFSGEMTNVDNQKIAYKVKNGSNDVTTNSTKIIEFGSGENTTKKVQLNAVIDTTKYTGGYTNPNVAGEYSDTATFKVNFGYTNK